MSELGDHQTKGDLRARANAVLREIFARSHLGVLVLLLAMVALRAADPEPVQTLRFEALDLMQRLEPREMISGKVAVVDIDEESIAALGQWPWSRGVIAELVRRLLDAEALVVGFDVLFSEADRLSPHHFAIDTPGLPAAIRAFLSDLPSNDQVLAETLRDAPVVLGMSTTGAVETTARRGRQTAFAQINGDPSPFLFSFPATLRSIEVLERDAAGQGIFSLSPESDGIVRRVPSALAVGDQIHPSLGIEMLRVAAGAQHYAIVSNRQGAGIERIEVAGRSIPTDANGRIWHRFSHHDAGLYLSAADILSGRLDPAAIAGKMVLVGTSAAGLRDLRATPLDQSLPGVEVHAQILDSILTDELLSRPTYALGAELGLALFLGGLLLVAVPRLSAGGGLLLAGTAVLGLSGTSFIAFSHLGLVLDATYPVLVTLCVYGLLTLGNYARSDQQKRQIRSAFSQYLSPDLVRQLTEQPQLLRLGGETRDLTFLFTDIAGFTRFTEQASPGDLVTLLNEYLDRACRIVMDHGGTVDKIVGDAIHAIFGAPLDQPDHAERAVKCALAVDRFAKSYYREKREQGHDFGATRIGVNSGPAVVGNFGGKSRFDYTAHGDAINTAARLEQANKDLGTTICVSGSTVERCPSLGFRPVGRLMLRGKEQAVQVFEPLGPAAQEPDFLLDYGRAYDLLAEGQPKAREAFDRLAVKWPDDALVALHLRRLAAGAQGDELVLSGA